MTVNYGKANGQCALELLIVGATDATGVDLEQTVLRTGFRDRKLPKFECTNASLDYGAGRSPVRHRYCG